MANSVDPDQTDPIDNRRLQQTTFSDAFFSGHLKG